MIKGSYGVTFSKLRMHVVHFFPGIPQDITCFRKYSGFSPDSLVYHSVFDTNYYFIVFILQ